MKIVRVFVILTAVVLLMIVAGSASANGQPPVADAGGPYLGAIDAPITFDGSG